MYQLKAVELPAGNRIVLWTTHSMEEAKAAAEKVYEMGYGKILFQIYLDSESNLQEEFIMMHKREE